LLQKKDLQKQQTKNNIPGIPHLGGSLEDRFETEHETELAPVMLGSQGGRNTRGGITKESLGVPSEPAVVVESETDRGKSIAFHNLVFK
jgi:hypothetical protein